MNKENKCALCSHRSVHNGSCLVDNQGCKFKPNAYCEMFAEELEKIKADIIKYHQIECNRNCDNCKYIDCIEAEDAVADIKIIDKHISELKGEQE